MEHVIHKQESQAIVYDASLMDDPPAAYFSVDFWKAKQLLKGKAVGRGSAWFIAAPFGPVVLRQYLRGGWAAWFSRRSYWFTTVERSRPFREYHILVDLFAAGLPVPRPVAALCEFRGLVSQGALITSQIPSARPLADVLQGGYRTGPVSAGFWEMLGKCLRKFHAAGVWHADLNARNILINTDGDIFLIDFDRARFKPGRVVRGRGNLKRLRRSLLKIWPVEGAVDLQTAWAQLETGYADCV